MPKPVSYHQERLWFIDRFERGNLYESSPVYHNIPLILKISGPLEIESLQRAVAGVIDRHEVLRTRVITVNHGPVQRIDPHAIFTLEFLDLSKCGQETKDGDLLNLALEEVCRPFLIEKDLLIRGKLYKKKHGEFLLVLVLHHIIVDHYSLNILVQEMFRFYRGIRSGKEPRLPGLALHYADFARWQRDFSPKTLKPLQIYWKRKLRGKLQPLELPTDRPRALVHIFKTGRKNFSFPKTISMITGNQARQTGSSPMVVLLSAFKVLLYRYSGLEEIIVGTAVENRGQPETREMMGPIANLVVLRSHISGEMTFSRFVSQLRETVGDALRYGAMPFDRLVTELDPHKDMSRTAFFDVLFQYREQSPGLEEQEGLTIDIIETNLGWGKYDLNVLVEDKGETLSGMVVYNEEYYDDWRISRMIDHFINIAGQAAAYPDRQLKSLDMLTREEKYQLLEEWSGTARKVDFPRNKTIDQLFEEQVEKCSNQVALIGRNWKPRGTRGPAPLSDLASITYRELNNQSHGLVRILLGKGVKTDTIVGIMSEHSVEMIIGILGILKAGGAYLPIDPDYPQERIDYMLKDSGASILLATEDTENTEGSSSHSSTSLPFYPSTLQSSPLPAFSHLHLSPPAPSTSLAYIIYTSGSTGRPKGVLVTHRNVVRLLVNDGTQFDFGPRDVWTMFHSPCFDFSVWEMYGALLFGGKLLVIPRATARDTQQYLQVLKKHQVTVLNQTPSAFYALMNEEFPAGAKELNLGYVIFGGEALAPGKIKPWQVRYPHTRLINMYGITETTVHVTFKEITGKEIQENLCNIGKPITTLFVYVLDSRMQPAAVGAPGELCVGGEGLARGYLNQPRLTAEKFVENPHKHGSRLYRSGDLVRFLNNSEMEYLGRMDSQVQLRGFRVEPGEIENKLTACPWVKEAVINVWEDEAGEKFLCAYFIPGRSARDKRFSKEELREYLLQALPNYMIPAYFIPLEKIPLTANGKIDRKVLPAPGIERGKDYVAPRDDIEKKLVGIWWDILGVEKEKISIDANFFYLGGHSLKVTVLASRIHKEFNINVPLSEIFITPHIRGLATYIKAAAGSKYIPVQPVEKREYYPLSSAQRRLYILQQMDAEKGTAYNMPALWQVEGDFNVGTFEAIFQQLIRRHEGLRTFFTMVNDGPVQRINEETVIGHWSLVIGEVEEGIGEGRVEEKEAPFGQVLNAFGGSNIEGTRGVAPLPKKSVTALISSFIRPFDLSQAPLLRVELIKLLHTPSALRGRPSQEGKGDKYLLMVDMHHIISDGMSMGIVVKEIMEMYAGKRLPQLKLQYKDYSEWHHRLFAGQYIKEQETYWLKQFEREVPVLDVPRDYPRPAMQSFTGRTPHFEMNREETTVLKALARDRDVTLFMLLLSLYTVFLSKLSGQEDIVVGTPIAGRRHTDLPGIIGMFVNTLALRNFPVGEKTFSQFLREIKENTIKAFENQDYLYEDLVEQVEVERDTGRNPLFDTVFTLQNIDTPVVEIPGLKVLPYGYENRVSKFDLTLTAVETEERLAFSFEYCTRLFKKETIRRFIDFLKKTISTVLANHETRISGIDIITGEEKNRILLDFNDTGTGYPLNKTISQLFADQVEKRPDNIAVIGEMQSAGRKAQSIERSRERHTPFAMHHALTYRELYQESNQSAHLLIEKGVKPGIIVGIMLERSIEMVIGILGILQVGGAYLPIDPDYPEDRIDFMLKDSNARVLITTRKLQVKVKVEVEGNFERPPTLQLQLIHNETDLTSTFKPALLTLNSTLTCQVSPANLAYVMYTSGTTGGPKGVLVTQRNVVRLVKNTNYIQLTEKTRILQTGAPVFDAATFEIWGSLLNGGQLLLTGKEAILDARQLGKTLECFDINTLWLSAPLFNQLLDDDTGIFSSLEYLLVGGDVLSSSHINGVRRALPGLAVINGYGPTENTTFSTTYRIRQEFKGSIPIGKPIANSTAYVVDGNGHLQPIGVNGELLVGGDGVSYGYLNNPELTAEKFDHDLYKKVPGRNHMQPRNHAAMLSPLHPITPSPHSLIYRTGDLVRLLSDGNIEFLRRIDHQVKVRGFRIELGEIENQLLAHGKVKEAIVLARKDNNDKYLCAYIVAKAEESNPIDQSGLREYLSNRLPDYMVPSYFVQLDKVPLTPNGKVNRKALPEPEMKTGKNYTAPRNEIEEILLDIWSEILNVEKEKISINDNFFHLGGHSLKATVLASRIHKGLNVNIPLTKLFKTPYIRGLAAYIKETALSKYSPVQPFEKKEYYPLSSAQSRLYILQRMDEQGIGYNMPSIWQVEGDLDIEKFETVFHQLIQRHESLRTCFTMVNDEPVQGINEEIYKLQITYKEAPFGQFLDAFAGSNIKGTRGLAPLPKEPVTALISSFIRPFDLSKAPLLRVELIKLLHTPSALRGHPSQEGKGDKYLLMVDMHHIISDGLSIGIFVKEIIKLYAGIRLPQLKLQYKDYSEWHNRVFAGQFIKEQETYWLKQFEREIPVLDVPRDYPRPAMQSFTGQTLYFEMNREETAVLKSLARKQDVTLFMLLLSLYTVFLSKLSGQEDIVVGTPIAGRRHTDLQGIMGMFVNTLALRNFPVGEKTFNQLLREIKENTIKAFENQDYLYEDLVEQVEVERDTGRNPIFDTMFTLQNMDTPTVEIPGLKVLPYDYESRVSKFDLTLTAVEIEERLGFSFEYCTRLFNKETMQRFTDFLKKTILTVLENHETRIFEIEILTGEEKNRILLDFNDTGAEYPRDKTISELFAEQVEKSPDNIAVIGEMQSAECKAPCDMRHVFTYREIYNQSNRLARILTGKGVAADTIVGIMVERSVEMIVGIMGILKSGGAYLPIDPQYPQDRIDFMLKDSSTEILLTDDSSCIKNSFLSVLSVSSVAKPAPQALLNFSEGRSFTNDQLAYIIYTSGSTGKPKGVMVAMRPVINLLVNLQREYPLEETGVYLLKTSFIFDVSVTELFGWFPGGGRLAILNPGEERDPGAILYTIEHYQVTHINFVPSMFKIFLEKLNLENIKKLSYLRYIFLAGEALLPELVQKTRSLNLESALENLYGPTEAAVYASGFSLSQWNNPGPVPIGKPIANIYLYILDRNVQILPIGISGQLFIGGAGLARGYLNKPVLTAEEFNHDLWNFRDYHDKERKVPGKNHMQPCIHASMQSPLHPISPSPHSPIYQTGDLARWLPDGNIEFLGRIDNQVKIRGFRIELEGIESHLLTRDEIKKAIVIAKEDETGDKYLCAYIVSDNETPGSELRESLLRRLPHYMVPLHFVFLAEIPLTPNGKVDRKALPAPGIVTGDEYIAPRNEVEEKLAGMWSELLQLKKPGEKNIIGIDANFFEIGGHSLKAVRLISKVHKEFEVDIPLDIMFRLPTIRGLARFLRKTERDKYSAIKAVEKKEFYPLSSSQKRFYLLQQMGLESTAYNMPQVLNLEGAVDREKLEQTFRWLIQRHESFRTLFTMMAETPVQRIHDRIEFEIESYNVESPAAGLFISARQETPYKDAIKKFIRPFHLSHAPLLRVGLIKVAAGSYLLMMDIHHIIGDAESIKLLVEEFTRLYEEQDLPALRIQYKEYSLWQNSEVMRKKTRNQEQYWLKEFSQDIPVLNLPTDYPRPKVRSFAGDILGYSVEEERTAALKKMALEHGATLYMVLLVIFNVFLYKISGQEDFVVGTPVAGRRHFDLKNIIGIFVNTLALRIHLPGKETFRELLKTVKAKTLAGFENQEYQFEDLVEKLEVNRDIGRNPLFDVMFAWQEAGITQADIPGVKLKNHDLKSRNAKFDLLLHAKEAKGKLFLGFEYWTRLFSENTIRQFTDYLDRILSFVIGSPDISIARITLMSAEQKKQVLFAFNHTQRKYPKDNTIQWLFAEQAARTPGKVAVVYEFQAITYKKLDGAARNLASSIWKKGINQEAIVAIMARRSLEMIVGILAVIKVGGVYLPIDPTYPEERKQFMMKDCQVNILLCNYQAGLNDIGEIIPLQDVCKYENGPDFKDKSTANNLAYVVYTSGSTGTPKGVMVKHRNVVRLVKNTNYITFREQDRILQTGALEFDASTFEIWGALLNGITLYLADKEKIVTHEYLQNIIKKYDISTAWMTSPLFNRMALAEVDIFAGLTNLLVGGETLSPFHINKVKNRHPDLKIINGYGPTENTTFSTTFCIDKEYQVDIPIGAPIANSTVYIFDKYNNPQPIKVVGELCVGGDGVARGYLNRVELTREKFTAHPIKKGEIIYKTGDLARWLPDGNIEFLGRIDCQVKLRGFRVELGEIESHLLTHEKIKEAVVTAKDDEKGEKFLCAYIISAAEMSASGLREYLSDFLPDYMVPVHFIFLEKIPLTANGKVDRDALPEPEINTGAGDIAPRNELERRLAETWKELLHLKFKEENDTIGIDTNFFRLGGHSLNAAQLLSRIHELYTVNIPMKEIFLSPTIRGLSKYISEAVKEKCTPLEIEEEKEFYPLSSSQKRLYILQRMDVESAVYNIPQVLRLAGKMDKECLRQAFRRLIHRHESLRTSFIIVNEEPVQRLHKQVDFSIEYHDADNIHDLQDTSRDNKNQQMPKNIVMDFIRPFDLSKAPLLRAVIIETGKETGNFLFIIDVHHIVFDGASLEIFLKELVLLYQGKALPAVKFQYKDYTRWLNREEVKEAINNQETYWLKEFEDEIPLLNLLTDYPRPVVRSYEGSSLGFSLESETAKGLNELAIKEKISMHMLIFAIFNVFLARISGQEDIVVGIPVKGRSHEDLNKIIGFFVNTLAIRSHPGGKKTFKNFLAEIKEKTLKAFENQVYQFSSLVEKLVSKRDVSRNPLFDVMFSMPNIDPYAGLEGIQGLTIRPYKYKNTMAKFDLTLNAAAMKEQVSFTCGYSTKLFKEETMQRFAAYLNWAIRSAIKNPGTPLLDIEILPPPEKRKILHEFNNPGPAAPNNKTMLELFDHQVSKTPDYAAAVNKERVITYRQMKERAGGLARYLGKKGVKPGNIAAILLEPSLEMIIGVMGILKAGGAFLLLDPVFPGERLAYMLRDSNAGLLLANTGTNTAVGNCETIDTGDVSIYASDNRDNTKPGMVHAPRYPACVFYISAASTVPRGVVLEHKNLLFAIELRKEKYPLLPGACCFNWVPCSYPGFVLGFLFSLLSGARLILPCKHEPNDTPWIKETIRRHRITHLLSFPLLYRDLVKDLTGEEALHLQRVTLCGDKLSAGILEITRSKGPHLEIVNEYGVTEGTGISTISSYKEYRFQRDERAFTVGKPAAHTHIYIMDKNHRLQPIGIPGELYISGQGVGRGYLNDAELSRDIFADTKLPDGKKISTTIRTGDLARWLPDGSIEFLGKIDHQEYMAGCRIDVEEIKKQILTGSEIEKVEVLSAVSRLEPTGVQGEKGKTRDLCAYIVSEKKLDTAAMEEYLSDKLPHYMRPKYFIQVDEIPLTPHGKVDREKLLKLETGIITREEEALTNPAAKKLREVWQEVLDVEKVGINDDFFQLGGDSLKALEIIVKLETHNLILDITDLFFNPTIKQLQEYVKVGEFTSIVPVEKKEYHRLSSDQRRLYFTQQMDLGNTAYNMPGIIDLGIEANIKKLEETFNKLIKRHESLRTSFEIVEGEPVQRIHDEIVLEIDYHEIGEEKIGEILNNFVKPFDLGQSPLIRTVFVNIHRIKFLLLLDMHHIISDRVSHKILSRDFVSVFNGEELAELRIQYKDYVEWQNRESQNEKMKKQEEYWLKEFEGEITLLNLPTDYDRPETVGFEGSSFFFKLDSILTGKIKKLVSQFDVTLMMILISAYKILLLKYTGQEDVIVGISIDGRQHADLSHIVGFFINILPIRTMPNNNKTFSQYLAEVKEKTINAYENTDFQFEELINKLKIQRQPGRHPLIDTFFEYRDLGDEFNENKETHLEEHLNFNISHFDLMLFGLSTANSINMHFEYTTALFEKTTIIEFSNSYMDILNQIVENQYVKLNEIKINFNFMVSQSDILQNDKSDWEL